MKFLFYGILFLFIQMHGKVIAQRINIIPEPVSIIEKNGSFQLNDQTVIVISTNDSVVKRTVDLLIEQLAFLSGIHLKTTTNALRQNSITIKLGNGNGLNKEGYLLDVSADNISITAPTAAGVFYAFESLKQLLPVNLSLQSKNKNYAIPCCSIKDAPQYSYRGMHFDVSRHFFSTAFIKKYIDLLATFKINVFHWHLTDSHGWRLEIKQYPKLTAVGAWRADRTGIPMTLAKPTQPGEAATYGGFYTQQEVKDIIQYAQQRNITIIPEIEMPGHCTAALVAYPEYGDLNNKTPLLVPCGYEGDLMHNFCAGYDSTYIFLQNILKEVIALFPSEYIHIGGDEVRPGPWMNCPRCQAKMKEKGFTTATQLQAYFTSRIDSFITASGKKMMGWDEIVGADIAKSSVSMSWHGESKATEAANKGNTTVMTPYRYTYFDFYQSDPHLEPDITYARLQLDSVYQFNPMPQNFTAEKAKYILGGQACLWTENVTTEKHAEYMLLPRLMALSEALWTPQNKKDYAKFITKTELQNQRFDAAGIAYANSMYNVNIMPSFDSVSRTVKITLANQTYQYPIHYTTDGTVPSVRSSVYTKSFTVDKSSVITTSTFKENRPVGKVNRDTLVMHNGIKAGISMQPINELISRLNDGIIGTVEPYDGRWMMLADSVATIIIDLHQQQLLHNFSMRFMEDQVGFLYLPKSLTVSISLDGITYSKAFSVFNKIIPTELPRHIKTYKQQIQEQARFVKIEIQNAWLNDTADKNIMSTDEIILQ